MTTNRAFTLSFEPPDDGEPIAGSLCDERGTEHRFAGWLGLLTLLEQARPMSAREPQPGAGHVVDGTLPSSEQGA